jgi:hypothetical protein
VKLKHFVYCVWCRFMTSASTTRFFTLLSHNLSYENGEGDCFVEVRARSYVHGCPVYSKGGSHRMTIASHRKWYTFIALKDHIHGLPPWHWDIGPTVYWQLYWLERTKGRTCLCVYALPFCYY